MSTWNDGGAGGAAGGQGGQIDPSSGGAGGSAGGSPGGGSIVVPGGTRDLQTTQCTSTSGGTCAVPGSYLACLEGSCGAKLTACYYSDGVSRAAGGVCQLYANCMLACPCNSGRSNCENSCMQNYASPNPDCSACLRNLMVCSSTYGCTLPTTCTSASGGTSSGSAGSSGGSAPSG